MKTSQYLLKIAPCRVQDAFDGINNPTKYSMECDAWNDDMREFTSWLCTKYSGKKVLITIKIER